MVLIGERCLFCKGKKVFVEAAQSPSSTRPEINILNALLMHSSGLQKSLSKQIAKNLAIDFYPAAHRALARTEFHQSFHFKIGIARFFLIHIFPISFFYIYRHKMIEG